MAAELKGKIQTVLGPIDPSTLGRTLTHEHLHMTYTSCFQAPRDEDREMIDAPIVMRNLNHIKHFPYSNKANLNLHSDGDAIIEELEMFKKRGGSCIVEVSPIGIGRNIKTLADYSKKTGVHIVSGTGYYLACSMPPEMDTMKEEEIVAGMKYDLTEGADGTDFKCGVIGEVGCSWPLHPNEKKVLRAAGITQSELGCPVIIHPGRNEKHPELAPTEHLRIFQEAGGVASHTVMSHLDRCCQTPETVEEFAKLGCYLEYDLFGNECSYYQTVPTIDFISDAQRISLIKGLVDEGYVDKIVIAHDIHTRHRLLKYGGHGYSHILENVVPKMLVKGMSQENIDKILIDNPRSWLTYF
ncbi:phosphotriesterase-related protein-like [Anneissia japonica]|uniref:phosphotriesterase-related protein-like n=1 Tax=Anneissia japonica TaxID=1529436 RepID=UPI001425AAAB|nr:phosphotriesterase-related protein-like [Anneissia japonica]XP_033114629.1 phosphotriesterase-related protein-like [Anneissia japonica]